MFFFFRIESLEGAFIKWWYSNFSVLAGQMFPLYFSANGIDVSWHSPTIIASFSVAIISFQCSVLSFSVLFLSLSAKCVREVSPQDYACVNCCSFFCVLFLRSFLTNESLFFVVQVKGLFKELGVDYVALELDQIGKFSY